MTNRERITENRSFMMVLSNDVTDLEDDVVRNGENITKTQNKVEMVEQDVLTLEPQ